jgi:ComF family protein
MSSRHLIDRMPSSCRICRCWGASTLCGACLQRFSAPQHRCQRCGLPLPGTEGAPSTCGACTSQLPVWKRAVCAQDYAFPWSELVGDFKFKGDVALARLLAQQLADALRQAPQALEVDLVLPVPLSAARLQERGFNQSWELARRLGRIFGLTCHADLLQRPVDTAHQVDLSLQERDRNLRGAFMVTPGRHQELAGRRVALVDDVMTTGATLREATRTLLLAGAFSVDVWTVARTP